MLRVVEQRLRRLLLDDAAEIHDRHLGRDVLDDREIVADEQIGEAEVAAQLRQQVQDLRLHRDVERRSRLVAHHDARPQHEGARNGDALALAAGQFGGETIAHLARQADTLQHLVDPLGDLGAGEGALRLQRHRHDVADAGQRIERRERILEHRLDQPRAGLAIHVDDALALDRDVAGVGREQAQDQAGEGGLAAARFAHDPEHAARRHGKRDAVDGDDATILAQDAARDAEGFADGLEFDRRQRCRARAHTHGANRQR